MCGRIRFPIYVCPIFVVLKYGLNSEEIQELFIFSGSGSPEPSTSGFSVASPASLFPASSSSEMTAPSPEMSAPSPSSSHSASADSPHVVAQIDSPGTAYSSFSLGSPSFCAPASGSPIDYSTRRSRQSPPRWSVQPRSPRTLPPPPSSVVVFPASPSSSVSAHSPSPFTSRSCSRTLSVSVDVTTNQDEPMSPGRLPLHSM